MAITQQLVRITESELQACQSTEQALDDLISFKLDKDRYLDLDWAPSGLRRCFAESQQSLEVQQALEWGLSGIELINSAYPEGPTEYIVWSQITYLDVDKVKVVASHFQQINTNTLFEWLPDDLNEANALLNNDLTIHPRIYYSEHLENLLAFYTAAARGEMATGMWWD